MKITEIEIARQHNNILHLACATAMISVSLD